jgi:hypothetical protein
MSHHHVINHLHPLPPRPPSPPSFPKQLPNPLSPLKKKEGKSILKNVPIIKLFNLPGAARYANSKPGTLAKISEIAIKTYAGICQRMLTSFGR